MKPIKKFPKLKETAHLKKAKDGKPKMLEKIAPSFMWKVAIRKL